MSIPEANDIRELLEGYGITDTVITDNWINKCITREVIPHIENITGLTFDTETTVTEYYSGNGKTTLFLNRKPVVSLTTLTYVDSFLEGNLVEAVELIAAEGIIKAKDDYSEGISHAVFRKGQKNIKVTYTYGYTDYPDDIAAAIENMTAARVLNQVGARTGGGSLTVQAHGRNFGAAGKYTDVMKMMINSAYANLRKYMTGVI